MVEDRRIYSGPTPAELILVFLVLGGALVGGLFASGVLPPNSDSGDVTPPGSVTPATVVKVQLSPDAQTELRSPQGEVEVLFETGAVDAIGQLWYRSLVGDQIPELPIEFVATGTVFELSLFGSPRVTSKPPNLIKNVFITVHLNQNHVATAGGVESNVVIQRYNEENAEENAGWSPLPTAVDFTAATARVAVRSLSIFALTIRQPSPSPEPVNGQADTRDPTPSSTPTPVSTTTPVSTVTLVPLTTATTTAPATSTPTITPALTPTLATIPTPAPTSVPTPTATPTPTAAPTPTSTPVFDGIYILTVDQPLDQSYSGRTITFRIGNLFANQTATWQQGETTELNLTASGASSKLNQAPLGDLTKEYSMSRTGALLASPERQPVPPTVFQGTVTLDAIPAPAETIVTAWIDGLEVGRTSVIPEPATPSSLSGAGVVFGPLGSDLRNVWRYDSSTKLWSFYDPRSGFAATNTLTEVASGDIVWIDVSTDIEFQGMTLYQGRNLIALP